MKILGKAGASVLTGVFALGFLSPVAVFAAGPSSVNLSFAGNFTILSKTGISTTGTTSIVGDIGVSPAAATYITGFALNLPAASAFSTSPLVVGKVFAPGYADPTPAVMTAAINDMQTAYTDAMGRTNPTATELGAGNIGGMTLAPGLYKWSTGVNIPSDVTLAGGPNDVWIFQIAQNLNVSSGVNVVLSGGALANNIFWAVAGQTTLGTTSAFKGNILDQTSIVLNTGAVLNGRALAQAAVTLDTNTVFVSLIAPPAVPVAVTTPAAAPVPVYTPVVSTPKPTETLCGPGQTVSSSNGLPCTGKSGTTDQVICGPGQTINAITGLSCGGTASVSSQVSRSLSDLAELSTVRSIKVNLTLGSGGVFVQKLQLFLIKENRGQSAAALGAHGTTTNFGKLTKAALAEWQRAVGISPATGNFGPKTRDYLRAHY